VLLEFARWPSTISAWDKSVQSVQTEYKAGPERLKPCQQKAVALTTYFRDLSLVIEGRLQLTWKMYSHGGVFCLGKQERVRMVITSAPPLRNGGKININVCIIYGKSFCAI
jgi:hypothetical protein